MIIYSPLMSWETVQEIAERTPQARVVYGARTCWWKIGDPIYSLPEPVNLPCDPRGGVLLETKDLAGFLDSARKNPEYYGKHGLVAFMAAYHGNIRTERGLPTCFEKWEEYNAVIDANAPQTQGGGDALDG